MTYYNTCIYCQNHITKCIYRGYDLSFCSLVCRLKFEKNNPKLTDNYSKFVQHNINPLSKSVTNSVTNNVTNSILESIPESTKANTKKD